MSFEVLYSYCYSCGIIEDSYYSYGIIEVLGVVFVVFGINLAISTLRSRLNYSSVKQIYRGCEGRKGYKAYKGYISLRTYGIRLRNAIISSFNLVKRMVLLFRLFYFIIFIIIASKRTRIILSKGSINKRLSANLLRI